MSLVEAIDAAVAYVRAHPDVMTRAELNEFCGFADAVYVLAFDAGLIDALPRVPELHPQLESDGLPPVQFESKLNLPGDFDNVLPLNDDGLPPVQSLFGDDTDEEPVGERAFMVCASPRWFRDMNMLRRLADTRCPDGAGRNKSPNVETNHEAVWLGNGKVQIGDESLSLEPQFANVLQALVELGSATKPQLQKKSGRDEPGRLLKRLVERFPILEPYITRPGGRGRGGYRTTIQDGSKSQ